jgi:glycosyltransferase involved in cell wall biosynthesis
MKLLISAYACAPNRGSEYAVGWNWATEARRLGHEIWVLASSVYRADIVAACSLDPTLDGIHWIFPTVRSWRLERGIEPEWERTYDMLWQWAARREARRLCREVAFDAIHHVSWAGIRAMTFLGSLGPPLIIGPIGGGETSPPGLRDALGRRGCILERVRDLSSRTITFNPTTRLGLSAASVIFASTAATRNLFRGAIRKKTVVFSQLGLPSLPVARPKVSRGYPPRFLYAGRLLYWKGVHIALRAFADVARQIPGAQFTIVGDGPERATLEQGVGDGIKFVSRLPQGDLFRLYETYDLLLFPSLHDSGGFVALEALAHGMPVVCLDLGGPGDLVTSGCGIVVATAGLNTDQVAADMAARIVDLWRSPSGLAQLSAGALTRAQQFILSRRIKALYERAAPFLTLKDRAASPAAKGQVPG